MSPQTSAPEYIEQLQVPLSIILQKKRKMVAATVQGGYNVTINNM